MTVDRGPLYARLRTLEDRSLSKHPSTYVRAAREVLEFGLREDRGSVYLADAHHELMSALCDEDDVAHAEQVIAMSERIVGEDAEFEARLVDRVWVLNDRARAERALGRFDAALASLERAKRLVEGHKRKLWSVSLGAQMLWSMMHAQVLRGDVVGARRCAEKHASERRLLVNAAQTRLRNAATSKRPTGLARLLITSLPEYLGEVEILRLVLDPAHAPVLEAIEAYFAEHGDGGPGMTEVLHTCAQVWIQREAWEALVASAPMLDRELHQRHRPRWHINARLGAVRAHHALGQRDEARRAYYEIEGLRSGLVRDDLGGVMGELRALVMG